MSTLLFSRFIVAIGVSIGIGIVSDAHAATMTFNGLTTTATTLTSHSENGITIAASSPASPPTASDFAHFDVYAALFGGANPDNVGAIHTGNVGEQVTFTYNGGSAFDFLNIDITGWRNTTSDPTGATFVTFTSSSGAIHTVAKLTTGIVDFSSMVGWTNILYFTISLPIVGGNSFTCASDGDNCTVVAFDDVTVQAASATPLPAALPLFASGLGALGLLGWRRKRKKAALAA
jgi:PEP-CTERM motif